MLKIIFCLLIIKCLSFANGFEFNINIPIGVSFGLPNIDKVDKNTIPKAGSGFEVGAKVQLGYYVSISDNSSISILGELGYSYDTIKQSVKFKNTNTTGYNSFSYHSLQIGLLPKFNFKKFSIGIGGGIKLPFSATLLNFRSNGGSEKYAYYQYNFIKMTRQNSAKYENTENIENIPDGLDLSPVGVIGYIKLTFDYFIFLTDKHYLTIGLYFGCDFMNKERKTTTKPNEFGREEKYIYKNNDSAIDLGLQFGYRFLSSKIDLHNKNSNKIY